MLKSTQSVQPPQTFAASELFFCPAISCPSFLAPSATAQLEPTRVSQLARLGVSNDEFVAGLTGLIPSRLP